MSEAFDQDLDGDSPLDKTRSPQAILTALALGALVLGALSGLGMSLHYVPTPEGAHGSIRSIHDEIPGGAWIRSAHIWSMHTAVFATLSAIIATLFRGSFRAGGRFNWWSALALFGVTCALGLTGELLPWSRQAVTATEVRTGLVEQTPVLGQTIHRSVLGAPEISAPTLTRFHVLHTQLLPLLLIAVVTWRLRALRRLAPAKPRPSVFEATTFFLGCAFIGWRAIQGPEPTVGFVHVDGEAAFEARPEWHFLWLNGLIERVPGSLATAAGVYFPSLLALALVALPFLDRSRAKRMPHLAVLVSASLLGIVIVGLSAAQAMELEAPEPTIRSSVEWDDELRLGYQLVRREGCIECHVHEQDGVSLGDPEDEDWPTLIDLADADVDGIQETLLFPPDDMPAYPHLSTEEQLAIGRFLVQLEKDQRAARSR
ncbi:MAG: cytochrome b N-terminal domain-containing protein [Planctomycetota bacterium]